MERRNLSFSGHLCSAEKLLLTNEDVFGTRTDGMHGLRPVQACTISIFLDEIRRRLNIEINFIPIFASLGTFEAHADNFEREEISVLLQEETQRSRR